MLPSRLPLGCSGMEHMKVLAIFLPTSKVSFPASMRSRVSSMPPDETPDTYGAGSQPVMSIVSQHGQVVLSSLTEHDIADMAARMETVMWKMCLFIVWLSLCGPGSRTPSGKHGPGLPCPFPSRTSVSRRLSNTLFPGRILLSSQ